MERGKRRQRRMEWERKKSRRGGGGGGRSIQHPCLYHVITCQNRFKNKAFERPSRAPVQSIVWQCLPRPHWRVSPGHIKHDLPLREPVTHTTLILCASEPAIVWKQTKKKSLFRPRWSAFTEKQVFVTTTVSAAVLKSSSVVVFQRTSTVRLQVCETPAS